jgi:hypothetical protein
MTGLSVDRAGLFLKSWWGKMIVTDDMELKQIPASNVYQEKSLQWKNCMENV